MHFQPPVFFKRVVIAALILMQSACALLEDKFVEPPQLSLEGLSVTKLSFEEVSFLATVSVTNPNLFSINLGALDYQLQFNQQPFLQGSQNQTLKLNPGKNTTVQVPLSIKLDQLSGLLTTATSSPLQYELSLSTSVDSPRASATKIAMVKSGSLVIPQLPKIAISDIAVKSLYVSQLVVMVSFEIENVNASAFTLAAFDYQLSVSEQAWFAGKLPEALEVPGGSKKTVAVPITLNAFKVGTQLLSQIRTHQPLTYQLAGDLSLRSDIPLLERLSIPFRFQGETP